MLFLKLLTVSAAVLANLCVSYVMTSQTDEVKHVCTKYKNCTFKVTGSFFANSLSVCVLSSVGLIQAEDLMKKIEKEEVSVGFI